MSSPGFGSACRPRDIWGLLFAHVRLCWGTQETPIRIR